MLECSSIYVVTLRYNSLDLYNNGCIGNAPITNGSNDVGSTTTIALKQQQQCYCTYRVGRIKQCAISLNFNLNMNSLHTTEDLRLSVGIAFIIPFLGDVAASGIDTPSLLCQAQRSTTSIPQECGSWSLPMASGIIPRSPIKSNCPY
jgi:hypothetical protein